MLIISQANPAGHVAIVRLSSEVRAVVDFADGSPQMDVTTWLADLFLLGLAVLHELSQGTVEPGPEEVQVARLSLVGPEEDFLLLYGHPASGQVLEVPWPQAAVQVTAGIASQITAGVAAEAAEESMPDDASQLQA